MNAPHAGATTPGRDAWLAASGVDRPFVRIRNPEPSPGYYRIARMHARPVVSVLVPTRDADCAGMYERLMRQLAEQSMADLEIITVRGDPRQGRAINVAAALATGKYLLTVDDDTSLPDPETVRKLVDVMEAHPGIGMAGGSNVIPADAGPFVRKVMRRIPRRSWEAVTEITESDLAQHGCLIMRTAEFLSVGGENELIPRGLDPYLREEFRKIDRRVVLAPGVYYHHLPPTNLRALLRQFYRNGRQAAFANRYFSEWVIETPARHGAFRKRTPLALRAFRLPARLLWELATGKFLRFICESTYLVGFVAGWLRPEAGPVQAPRREQP